MPKVLSQAWEKFFEIQHAQLEDTNKLFQKLLEDLRIIREELAEYINSPSLNHLTFYDNDEEYSIQYKEYLENSSNAMTPVLPTEEPEYSLSMGTISKTKSDEVIKSSAKNLVPIPSDYEVTSDDEIECDVPIEDEFSPVFTTFSNPIFDCNDDFTSSDDESISDENVPIEDFKFDYLEEFSGALMPTSIADEERIMREHEEYISLMEKLLAINPCPRPLENFQSNTSHSISSSEVTSYSLGIGTRFLALDFITSSDFVFEIVLDARTPYLENAQVLQLVRRV
nr:hypothetical protein [Tanacetum cinerariifolium]